MNLPKNYVISHFSVGLIVAFRSVSDSIDPMEAKKITELNPQPAINQSGMDRKIEKKNWPPKKIALVAGVALFIAFAIYALLGDTRSKLNVDVNKITISPVVRGPFQEFIPVNGAVQPIQTFYLDAVEGGRVETRFVEAGAFVKKGDPILRLNNTNLQLDVMYREALSYEQINNARNTRITIEQNTIRVRQELVEVEFQLGQAVRNFVRDSALVARGLISGMEFKKSSDEYQYWLKRKVISLENSRQDSLLRHNQIGQLDASVGRLTKNVEMTRQNLANLVIRAPISGQLSSLNAEIGQSKSAGERLGQIDVLDSFKVRVAVDEFYISRINPGQTGEFDFAGNPHRLVIKKVYPEVRDGRFEVDMEFIQKPPQGIRRGQTLQIRLELGDLAEATLIPRGGFYQKTGGQWVFIVDKSGDYAVKRSVKLGRQNPQAFEVLEGLEPGEQVVTSSYDTFGDAEKLVLKR
jgi:HlyD family secretion protein